MIRHLSLGGGGGSGLLVRLSEREASRRLAVATILTTADAHNVGVDGAGDAVMVLDVGLRNDVLLVD